MELDSREALRIFRAKGATWLRHANTVQTVCTFFREGHILARGVVHERSLAQTDQQSDRKDRRLGIWYDLFFDATDIHTLLNSRNFYGPVLLNFDLSLLEQDWLPFVWVTKSNPVHWKPETPSNERWFTSIAELEAGYKSDNVGQHIVLRNVAGTVRLIPYLREIMMDQTSRTYPGGTEPLHKLAWDAIVAAAKQGNISGGNIKTYNRNLHSSSACKCSEQYQGMKEVTALKFFADPLFSSQIISLPTEHPATGQ